MFVFWLFQETKKYSVSADDLERADLSVSSSLTAPVFSGAYQVPGVHESSRVPEVVE